MNNNIETKKETIRVDGRLKEIITLQDKKGNILHKIISPLMVEFYPRDFLQIIIGASILAVPVAFTEEVWNLGKSLPFINVLGILLMSLSFISAFVYYNFYRFNLKGHLFQFLKRSICIYLGAFFVVSLFLILIQRAPWQVDWMLALKRSIIVSFPASMSAAVSDMLK